MEVPSQERRNNTFPLLVDASFGIPFWKLNTNHGIKRLAIALPSAKIEIKPKGCEVSIEGRFENKIDIGDTLIEKTYSDISVDKMSADAKIGLADLFRFFGLAAKFGKNSERNTNENFEDLKKIQRYAYTVRKFTGNTWLLNGNPNDNGILMGNIISGDVQLCRIVRDHDDIEIDISITIDKHDIHVGYDKPSIFSSQNKKTQVDDYNKRCVCGLLIVKSWCAGLKMDKENNGIIEIARARISSSDEKAKFSGDRIQVNVRDLERIYDAVGCSFTELLKLADLDPDFDLTSGNLNKISLRAGENLSSYNLAGCSMKDAKLNGVDLSNARLANVDLRGTDLRGANLSGADLTSARFEGADLAGSDLRGANLSGADLTSVRFEGADLAGSDLRGATYDVEQIKSANIEDALLPPSLEDFLREMAVEPTPPMDDLGPAFRRLYDSWVKLGGRHRGKNRNSVRNIEAWLGRDHAISSLEHKLAGKNEMNRQDVEALINLFLERWRYDTNKSEHVPFQQQGYIYQENSRRSLSKALTNEIFPRENKRFILPPRRSSRKR